MSRATYVRPCACFRGTGAAITWCMRAAGARAAAAGMGARATGLGNQAEYRERKEQRSGFETHV